MALLPEASVAPQPTDTPEPTATPTQEVERAAAPEPTATPTQEVERAAAPEPTATPTQEVEQAAASESTEPSTPVPSPQAKTAARNGQVQGDAQAQAATPEPPTSITISPEEDFNPVQTQHTFTVEVRQADGSPAGGAEVEFFLNRFGDAVGDIVTVAGENPEKIDNQYARVQTRGDGTATVTITANREGATDVTACAPGIEDAEQHKVFAVKHWVDLLAEFPVDAENLVGTQHVFTVQVRRATNGEPLPGVDVRWTLADDEPDARFAGVAAPGNAVVTTTNAQGEATVTLEQLSPNRGENVVQAEVLGPQDEVMFEEEATKTWLAPELGITKTGPETIGLSQQAEYEITVENTGDLEATGLVVADQVPAGMQYLSSAPEGTLSGETVRWELGELAPEESTTLSLTLAGSRVGEWTNQVSVQSQRGFIDRAEATTQVIPGELVLEKSGPEQLNITREGAYEIRVENPGEGALTGVVVRDQVPAGMAFVSAEPEATITGQQVQWNLGTLEAGAGQSLSLTLRAQQAGTWTNEATVISVEGPTASAEATTRVVQPGLEVEKSAPATVLQEEEFTYELSVANEGEGEASGVIVEDTLPAGVTFLSAEPEATVNGQVLSWQLGTLEAGASTTLSVTVRASENGVQENVVEVRSAEGGTDTASATTQVEAVVVSVEKTGPGRVFIGHAQTYTLTVANTGEATLHEVTVTDNIPAGLRYAGSDPEGSVDEGTVTWEVGTLEPGETRSLSLDLRGLDHGLWTNLAAVTTQEGVDDESRLEIQVTSVPGATLSVQDSDDPVAVGEETTYSIVVRNQSEDAAMTEVALAFALPEGLSFVGADGPTEGTFTDGLVRFDTIATLGPEESVEFTVTVRTEEAGDLVARAELTYAEFSRAVSAEEGTTVFQP